MLFLDDAELDRLYPCRLILDACGVIEAAGPSVARLLKRDVVGLHFDEAFEVVSTRRKAGMRFADAAFRTPLVISTREGDPLLLRGAVIETGAGRRHLLLGGAPGGKISDVDRFRYGDFAPTDSAIEMFVATQARDASIEDARRLSGRLDEARAETAASIAKSRFLASMSHELRTPLNAIIGFTEIVMDDLAAAGVDGSTEDLNRVLGAATHLLGLVNDVLDLAKIEAGKVTVRADAVDFVEIAHDVAGTLDPLARKAGNRLLVDIADEVIAGVSDANRFRQCLINLIGNAIKFTRNGTVTLRLGRAAGQTGEEIVVSISDTGIGMTDEQMRRLFKPFVQATTDISSTFGGTGLGLVITQEAARLLGGAVTVESRPGAGSTFTLRVLRWMDDAARASAEKMRA